MILVHGHDDLVSLLLDFGLLLDNDVSQELLLQTLECHSEVDQSDLDANFGQVVRIRHLGCHEEPEVVVIVDVRVTKSHLFKTTLVLKGLLQQDGIDCGVYVFLYVFDEDWSSVTDSTRDLTEEVVDAELH